MINKTIRDKFTNKAIVIYKNQLKPNVFHIKIQSDFFKNMHYTTGQYFHVLVTPHSTSLLDLMTNRSYSIWQHDKTDGIIDMAICNLGKGPGSLWIENLQIGDAVFLTHPTGRFVISNHYTHHCFIGDVSALSHFYNMSANLKEGHTFEGYIYDNDDTNMFSDMATTTNFTFIEKNHFLIQNMTTILKNIPLEKRKKTMFYLGGDGSVCIALNKILKKDFHLSKENLTVKPFWKKNKKGL